MPNRADSLQFIGSRVDERALIRLHRIETTLQSQTHEYEHPMHQKISEIAQYIKSNYHERLTLEKVAKRFYISPSYLSRVFTKLTGFHFREYLQVVRIREARKCS